MDFSFSDLNLQLDGQLLINFNSVENLLGFEARAAFTVNSASVFRVDVDIVPTTVESLADAEAVNLLTCKRVEIKSVQASYIFLYL